MTCRDSLTECFHIFTDLAKITLTPAIRNLTRGINLETNKITVFTDGACMKNGKADTKCSSGIWFGREHRLNKAIKVPGPHQSNQVGKLIAVIATAEVTPNFLKLRIVTDSKYVIEGLTEHLPNWENRGWIGISNTDLFKRAAYLLKTRMAPTIFK